MSEDLQFFYEDEVYRITKLGNIQYGMVVENAELVSSDESDAEEGSKIKSGFVRVAWHPSGNEEIIEENKIGLADRSLMPGDVVRRMIKGQDTQRGYCRQMRVSACARIMGTNQIVCDVPAREFDPIEEIAHDVAVCLDSWVGGIKEVQTKVKIRLPDNSICIINNPDQSALVSFGTRKDKLPRSISEMEVTHSTSYYPGQVLWGPLDIITDMSGWRPAKRKYVHETRNGDKVVKVVIDDVQVHSIAVHWQCRAFSKDGVVTNLEHPKIWLNADDLLRLKLLNVFEPCTIQVGDKNAYVIQNGCEIITHEQWRKKQAKLVARSSESSDRFSFPINEDGDLVPSCEENGHTTASVEEVVEDDGNDTDWYSDNSEVNEPDTYSGSSAASTGTGKKQPPPRMKLLSKGLHRRQFKKGKRKRKPLVSNRVLRPGMRVIVETVSTTSTADVVWQDGTIEYDIPSTELYPIHHLDDQEFFPGDFVIENRDDVCMRIYGVVQCVDHSGRTAGVKWFRTYTSVDLPEPTFITETEVSVYDLKDHPDFQYRPGTVVIRVANFLGENEKSTAGQVLDNYPEGQIKVWWAAGHITMCWPQDLFKVAEYDSDEAEVWEERPATEDSEESWVAESEECPPTPDSVLSPENNIVMEDSLKPKLAANIEKARVAMSRLEEIFVQNPSLQTAEVMKKLLEVYKDCRYLDKLMGTTFFHESHFEGLIERVREEKGRCSKNARAQEQVNRLFSPSQSTCSEELVNGFVTCGDKANSFKLERASAEEVHLQSSPSLFSFPPPSSPTNVCSKLTTLILRQLLESHAEVVNRFGAPQLPPTLEEGDSPSADEEESANPQDSELDSLSSHTFGVPSASASRNVIFPLLQNAGSESGHSESTDNLLQESSYNGFMEVEDTAVSRTPAELLGGTDIGMGELNVELEDLLNRFQFLTSQGETTLTENRGLAETHAPLDSLAHSSGKSSEALKPKSFKCSCRKCELCKSEPVSVGSTKASSIVNDSVSEPTQDALSEPADEDLSEPSEDVSTELTPENISSEPTEDCLSEPMKDASNEPVEDSLNDPSGSQSSVNLQNGEVGTFTMLDTAPALHKFMLSVFEPKNAKNFFKALRTEMKILRSSLPAGIKVKGFEDRMDLFSVMIEGPAKTPYEGGLFFFDIQLSQDYPLAPPQFHYISYCSDRLNPNLYEDGKVCISLLGTWTGRGTEVWTLQSNLLQVLVSIQGLILVSEPYFNEAGYEKQRGTQQGRENSRMYNEMAILKLVQSMAKVALHPHCVFRDEIFAHLIQHVPKLCTRLGGWLDASEAVHQSESLTPPATPSSFEDNKEDPDVPLPDFPLVPASRGFCISLRKSLTQLQQVLNDIIPDASSQSNNAS